MGKSGIIDQNARWIDNTVVYDVDPSLSETFKATLVRAMNHITGRTCIVFKERMTEDDYVTVTPGVDCSSSVGRSGGRQVMSLGPMCGEFSTHVHLLVHVIGFGHEHNRADRNEYLSINYANIDPINHANFDTYPAAAYSPFSVPYDYGSVTHFGPKVQSSNGLDSMTPKQVGAVIGEAKGLSDLDIKKINNMYCSGSLGMMIRSVYDGSYLDVRGGIAGEGKEVITTKKLIKNHPDSQKWTVNWLDASSPAKGSTIASWAQDGGRLKVLDEDKPTGLISTWGNAGGYRNQLWTMVEVQDSQGESKRFQIKNMSTGHCLSAPTTRCVGLNLIEFLFKRFMFSNSCKGGHVRAVPCRLAEESRQLWNIDFV